jgi:hypothetical protein
MSQKSLCQPGQVKRLVRSSPILGAAVAYSYRRTATWSLFLPLQNTQDGLLVGHEFLRPFFASHPA